MCHKGSCLLKQWSPIYSNNHTQDELSNYIKTNRFTKANYDSDESIKIYINKFSEKLPVSVVLQPCFVELLALLLTFDPIREE